MSSRLSRTNRGRMPPEPNVWQHTILERHGRHPLPVANDKEGQDVTAGDEMNNRAAVGRVQRVLGGSTGKPHAAMDSRKGGWVVTGQSFLAQDFDIWRRVTRRRRAVALLSQLSSNKPSILGFFRVKWYLGGCLPLLGGILGCSLMVGLWQRTHASSRRSK